MDNQLIKGGKREDKKRLLDVRGLQWVFMPYAQDNTTTHGY